MAEVIAIIATYVIASAAVLWVIEVRTTRRIRRNADRFAAAIERQRIRVKVKRDRERREAAARAFK